MGPQGHAAAEVVSDDGGFVQAPVVQQFGEDLALGGQGDVLPRGHLRGSVPRHVPDEHLVVPGQGLCDVTPHTGGEGGAVQEHDRIPAGPPQAVPAHGSRRAVVRLT